ncbi:MAG: alpha-amylase family glycosyl hydrolase [Thermoguttaceae bacterium]
MASSAVAWWQRGVIYHIYPLSFQDSNGDGIGDLPGITRRLEYCRWLGCDAVWLSPIHPSPMADHGYDVSDYTDVHPLLGTLADFDALLAEARRLGLRVLLDLVPNHTSDRHPWFLRSRWSRKSRYRGWYIWRDPAPGGGPPNNWQSVFGGSAWSFDPATGQYYLHSYLKEQPDLNWRNPEVQAAMFEVMRFWLRRGVAGFRVDSISRLIKDAELRDNPPNPDYRPGDPPWRQQLPVYNADQPELHPLIARMRKVADRYNAILIGEAYLPVARLRAYYGKRGGGLHFPFNFQLVRTRWDARSIRAGIRQYEKGLAPGQWPNWVLSNHDNPRVACRAGRNRARIAAMLLLTLRGTPTVYYGDEIGMADVAIPAERIRDPGGRRWPGLGLGRDPARTPMQWDAGPQAGFTAGVPWLPIAEDYQEVNVASQQADARSLLWLYRRLIQLRSAEPALWGGQYVPVDSPEQDVVTYLRRNGGKRFLVAVNFASQPRRLGLEAAYARGRIVLSTHLDRPHEAFNRRLDLRGDEGVVAELQGG